jgi:hypothetical protein
VLYDNVISLIYDIYTSHVKHQVPLDEQFEERLVTSGWLPRPTHYEMVLNMR